MSVLGASRVGGRCRDLREEAEAAARLTACNAVITNDKVTGKPKAFATWYIGNSLLKKRDYDGALAVSTRRWNSIPITRPC